MVSPLYLTLLVGPMEPLPAPKPLADALVSVEVTESATGRLSLIHISSSAACVLLCSFHSPTRRAASVSGAVSFLPPRLLTRSTFLVSRS